MPKLTFDDVFLPEKEDVIDKIRTIEEQIQLLSIIVTSMMMDNNIKSIKIYREEFAKRLRDANLNDPVDMKFEGNNKEGYIKLTITGS